MAQAGEGQVFRPALIVVDMQEDFCPPSGTLAVDGARDLVPAINELLKLPFAVKVATKDDHPVNHISFASSHQPPDNIPFQSTFNLKPPSGQDSEPFQIPLWPSHCVRGTLGADLLPELDQSQLDLVVEKGRDANVEMFSAFADVFGNRDSGGASIDLSAYLAKHGVTTVFVVGVAGDYCVKCTAIDAAKAGCKTYAIEEAIRSVNAGQSGWEAAKSELERAGVRSISISGAEVDLVRQLKLQR